MPTVVHTPVDIDIQAWIAFLLAGVGTLGADGLDLTRGVPSEIDAEISPRCHSISYPCYVFVSIIHINGAYVHR